MMGLLENIKFRFLKYFSNLKFLSNSFGDFWFYISLRTFQFVRLITSTSALPSIFLGLMAVLISLYQIYFPPTKNNIIGLGKNLEAGLFLIFCFLFLIVISVYLARVFFKRQTPEQYAKFSIQGRQFSQGIRYISYKIWKLLRHHEIKHRKLIKKLNSINSDEGVGTKESKITKKEIHKFKNDVTRHYVELETIDYMISELSLAMSVPAFRISDFLFQFSPKIYYHEVRLCAKRLDELHSYQEQGISPIEMKSRTSNILDSFYTFNKRIDYQKSLFIYKNLHSSIIDISMGLGLTSSLKAYVHGLQKIGTSGHRASEKPDLLRQLRFLFHKRRMFPGFDIHCLLINLIEKNEKDITTGSKESIIKALRIIVNHKKYAPPKKKDAIEEEEEKESLHENPHLFNSIIPHTNNLVLYVNRHLDKQRNQIVLNFREFMIDELKKCELDRKNGKVKKIVFITRGYSSVVNNTLYKSIIDRKSTEYNEKLSELKGHLKYWEINDGEEEAVEKDLEIYYYILKSHQDFDDDDFTMTRYVRYQFKENPNIRLAVSKDTPKIKLNVKVGDEEWLKNRFDKKEECKCYLLSGAEFFQKETVSSPINHFRFRMINSEGIHKLKELGFFSNTELKHLVLAESYKEFSRPLENEIAKKALNRENIEFLHIYRWDPRLIIISNEILRNSDAILETLVKKQELLEQGKTNNRHEDLFI